MNNAQIAEVLKVDLKKIDSKIRVTPNQTPTILYIDLYRVDDRDVAAEAISALADRDSRISWERAGSGGSINLPYEPGEPKTARELYNEADEAGQMQMDLGWLRMGGHLSEEKMDRLVDAGLIGP